MTEAVPAPRPTSAKTWQKLLPWVITIACFAYLYMRISGAAAREEMGVLAYLAVKFRIEDGTKRRGDGSVDRIVERENHLDTLPPAFHQLRSI